MGLSKISITNQENFVMKFCTIKMFAGMTDRQTNAFIVKSMQTNAFIVQIMQTNAFIVKSLQERRLIIAEMDSLINFSPENCYYKIFIEISFFHYSPILTLFCSKVSVVVRPPLPRHSYLNI